MLQNQSSETKRMMFFMNYREIQLYFNEKNITDSNNQPLTIKQIRKAVWHMNHRHPNCEWLSELVTKRYHYVVTEGVVWLEKVFFRKDNRKSIDAEIDFFIDRIMWYENFCSVNNIGFEKFDFENTDSMTIKQKRNYLEKLEEVKMNLTKKCIERGFPYNNFFKRN